MRGVQPKAAAVLVAAAIAGLVIFVYFLRLGGGGDIGDKYRFQAVVPSALQLTEDSDVKREGVDVGKVEEIRTRGQVAVVEVALDPDEGPVRRDARVQVRLKTPVGESYLELDPGSPESPPLPDGGVLPLAQARRSVELDEILSVFPAERRTRLRRLLAGLGEGVEPESAKELNRLFEAASATVQEMTPVSEALAAERAELAGLVRDLGAVFAALGAQREDLRRLARGARDAARAVAGEEAAVRATLRELPPILRQAAATSEGLAGLTGRAVPVLDDLTVVLDRLVPVTKALPAASRATVSALRRLHRATPDANALLRSLRATAPRLRDVVPGVRDLFRHLRPMAAYVEPYSKDIGAAFSTLRSGGGAMDATSYIARPKVVLSDTVLVSAPQELRAPLQALLNAGLAQLTEGGMPLVDLAAIDGMNAYPRPGTAGKPEPFRGTYELIRPDP